MVLELVENPGKLVRLDLRHVGHQVRAVGRCLARAREDGAQEVDLGGLDPAVYINDCVRR